MTETGSKQRTALKWLIIGAVAVVIVIVGVWVVGVVRPGDPRFGDGTLRAMNQSTATSLPPDVAEAVATEATTDLGAYKSREYSKLYSRLSASDRKLVSDAEWKARAEEVRTRAGDVTGYRVVRTGYLDAKKTIAFAQVEVAYAKVPAPRRSMSYYVNENGRWTQTMMWGRSVQVDPGALR